MNYLQEKYALSEKGAKDLFKGIIYSALAYISLILPVALLAYVLNAFLSPLLGADGKSTNALLYTAIGIIILALIFLLHYMQYTVTYLETYQESERRRITLAEKLRTLPLRFFHKRDLSDLTSTPSWATARASSTPFRTQLPSSGAPSFPRRLSASRC